MREKTSRETAVGRISEALPVGRGVTALIGGGGKTTLMHVLAEELKETGTVILCTSTAILPPEEFPVLTDGRSDSVRRALGDKGAVCVGKMGADGKLHAPDLSFSELAGLADYVIAEADGSRGLPLKAHAPHEPVIPKNTRLTVLVIGIDGIGRPIYEACHRPELYAALAGSGAEEAVSLEMAARAAAAEGLGDIAFINKAEGEERIAAARELAVMLPYPAVIGSLFRREYLCLSSSGARETLRPASRSAL